MCFVALAVALLTMWWTSPAHGWLHVVMCVASIRLMSNLCSSRLMFCNGLYFHIFVRRMEMLEAAGCSLLSCNVAWHAEVVSQQHNGVDSAQHAGSSSIHDAIANTLEALDALQSPAAAAAPAFQVATLPGAVHSCCSAPHLQQESNLTILTTLHSPAS